MLPNPVLVIHCMFIQKRGKKTVRKDGGLIQWPRPEIERTKPPSNPLIQIRGQAASPLPTNTQPCFCSSFGLHPRMFHRRVLLILSRSDYTPRLSLIKANEIKDAWKTYSSDVLWAASSVSPLTFRRWPREGYAFKLIGKNNAMSLRDRLLFFGHLEFERVNLFVHLLELDGRKPLCPILKGHEMACFLSPSPWHTGDGSIQHSVGLFEESSKELTADPCVKALCQLIHPNKLNEWLSIFTLLHFVWF